MIILIIMVEIGMRLNTAASVLLLLGIVGAVGCKVLGDT